MTDNRTTELHKKLKEAGVKYTYRTLGCKTYTNWGEPMVNGAQFIDGGDWTELAVENATPEQAIAATLGSEINGDTSDGYHTFNELYHHRAVLFSVIVRDHRELAWKARKHHDGTMYDDMFIVGIETPKGQATYHYDLDPYWEMFDCEEREYAPEWDGHTPDDAIARIAELGSGTLTAEQVRETVEKHWHDLSADYDMPEATALPEYSYDWQAIADELNARGERTCKSTTDDNAWCFVCSECGKSFPRSNLHLAHNHGEINYCPNCGARRVDA